MKEIRIIVASPSPLDRSRLGKVLATHPGLRLIGVASDLSEAYTMIEAQEPQIVLIAQDFVRTEEFACMKSLFYAVNAIWIEVGEPGLGARSNRYPDGTPVPNPVVKPGMTAEDIVERIGVALTIRKAADPARPKPPVRGPGRMTSDKIVLIGASTGGIDALLSVLSHFPADCPPTAIVQHTGKSFSDSLIRLLDRRCAATVRAAEHGLLLQPGVICVAGGSEGHLRLGSSATLRTTLTPGPAVSGHTPSVDELFHSAVPSASKVVAALLTGMGRDGAAGLLALRNAGATTIGQDAPSSVVYGMPRAAWEIGAVQQQLPLSSIGPAILRLCAQDAKPRMASR